MPLVRYSVLRLAVLVGCAVVLFLVGMRGWWWLLASVIVAALVSYLALPRQRTAAAETLERRAQSSRKVRAERAPGPDESAEDAALDSQDPGDDGAASSGGSRTDR